MLPQTATLVMEIGGTNVRVALRYSNGELAHQVNFKTNAVPGNSSSGIRGTKSLQELRESHDSAALHAAELVETLLKHCATIRAKNELSPNPATITAAGVGIAGAVDGNGIVRYAPNLGWPRLELATIFTDELGLPTVVENDATAAVIAESCAPAITALLDQSGTTERTVFGVTLGTGIGSALTLNGVPVRGAHDDAYRFGHAPVVAETKLRADRSRSCKCGRVDCHRMYLAGEGLVITTRELVEFSENEARGAPTLGSVTAELASDQRALQESFGENLERITATDVRDAAVSGNVVARAAFSVLGHQFGAGLDLYIRLAGPQPQVISVGGGLGSGLSGQWIRESARASMEDAGSASNRREKPPQILPMAFAEDAGLHGIGIKAEYFVREQDLARTTAAQADLLAAAEQRQAYVRSKRDRTVSVRSAPGTPISGTRPQRQAARRRHR